MSSPKRDHRFREVAASTQFFVFRPGVVIQLILRSLSRPSSCQVAIERPLRSFSEHLKPALARRVIARGDSRVKRSAAHILAGV